MTPCSTEHDSTDHESSKICSEITNKEDNPEENAEEGDKEDENMEDNKEGKAETKDDDSKTSGILTFIAESLPQSPKLEDDSKGLKRTNINNSLKNIISSQEDISCQTNPPTDTRENKREKQTVMSPLDVPPIQFGRVPRREEVATPPEPNEKATEALKKALIPPNEERTEITITIQSEDEQPGDDDDDIATVAKDVLCFAWQIAEGMVSAED